MIEATASPPEAFTMPTGANWHNFAKCGVNPDTAAQSTNALFFQDLPYTAAGKLQAEEARAICNTCPVADWCLQRALNLKEEFGVWGGLTQPEMKEAQTAHAKALGQITLEQAADIRRQFAHPATPQRLGQLGRLKLKAAAKAAAREALRAADPEPLVA